jgi:hypothetical protein
MIQTGRPLAMFVIETRAGPGTVLASNQRNLIAQPSLPFRPVRLE